MLTLFIGVVTTAMEAATQEKILQQECDARLKLLVDSGEITTERLELYQTVFQLLDNDGSGTIEFSEIQLGLSCVEMYPNRQEINEWIISAGLDPYQLGFNIEEFVRVSRR